MHTEGETHAFEWEPGSTVTVRVRRPPTDRTPMLVLAHGAGTDQDHPGMTELRDALTGVGLGVVTFNYPYTEAGRRAPDRVERLLACHRAVAGWVRASVGDRLALGGRSMGGRMASMLVAEGERCRALVLYGYPLHPAGRPERLRIEHLPAISVPMVFFRGERDALSRPDLFDRHIRPLPGVTCVDVPGADHSFRISGVDLSEVMAPMAEQTRSFLEDAFGPWRQSGA